MQLDELGQSYEIIFVDDGSTDKTFAEIKKLYDEHPGVVRVICFRRNFGKTPRWWPVSVAAGARSSLQWTATCRTTRKRFPTFWRN